MALLSALAICVCTVSGIVFSLVQWLLMSRVRLEPDLFPNHSGNGYNSHLIEQEEDDTDPTVVGKCAEIQSAVSEGVKSFLFMEYKNVGVFMVAFAVLIFLFLGSVESFSTQSRPCTYDPSNMRKPALATAIFSTVSFLFGAFTSALSCVLGTKVATYANPRTTLEVRNGVGRAFIAAFRSGAVMGFLLAANGLLVLYIAINLFKLYYGNDWEGLFEAIAGYGLGGSSMALFGRVGGRIYAMAANVGADLVRKFERNITEDRRNPAVIADNAGHIVGDIAGMGTDLFGSYAESSCAALFVASISSFRIDHDFTAMCYPMLISSMGILVCSITTLFATDFFKITRLNEIEPALKMQLIISTILMTLGIAIVSWIALPSSFTIYNFGSQKVVKNWQLFLYVAVGLWAGRIIGFVTAYCTRYAYRPVQDVIYHRIGVATIVIFAIAISIFVRFSYAAVCGIVVAALGMLSTIATGLAIDAYGPISDNVGGIAKMACMSPKICESTKALKDAGNATAAIGKGFAIGSAALVSLALFGGFWSRAAIPAVEVLTPMVIIGFIRGAPMVFIGFIGGAMLPHYFYVMIMKRVGSAALKMVQEVLRQFDSNPGLRDGDGEPDYASCVKVLTAFWDMISPGALVVLTPLIVGTLFGVETLAGVLAGSLFYVVLNAILAPFAGGAWNNAKEYAKVGASEYVKTLDTGNRYWDMLCEVAEREDTFGDTVKDTSGPPLNILIQLMAMESLVFAPFFATHGGLLLKIF